MPDIRSHASTHRPAESLGSSAAVSCSTSSAHPTLAHPVSTRSIEIDFLRGLALMMILVDHTWRSKLAHLTLRNYAFCDAAELFVFLSGYVAAAAYVQLALRRGWQQACWRFIRRSLEIYLAYLVVGLTTLGLCVLLLKYHIDTPTIELAELQTVLADPKAALLSLASLHYQPAYSHVLPMYIFFVMLVPILVLALQRHPIYVLLASLGLWYVAHPIMPLDPSGEIRGFNPYAWQLIFVLGMLLRLHAPHTLLRSRTPVMQAAWPRYLALTVVLVCWFSSQYLDLDLGDFAKRDLAWIRTLNFLALASLTARLIHTGKVAQWAGHLPFVSRIGRHSLLCFSVGTVITLAATTTLYQYGPRPHLAIRLIVDCLALYCLYFTARLADWWDRRK